MRRESFIVYKSFYHLIKLLKQKDQLKMYEAIFEYGLEGIIPKFDNPSSEAVWNGIFPQLKANQRRYENGMKGAEAGVLGGRPKNNPLGDIIKTPRITPNENVNVNENENVLKESKKESKEDIFKNQSTRARESYDQIIADMEFSKPVENKVKEFIKHCFANGHVLINSELEGMLVQLDLQYETDELKIQVLDDAIKFGYFGLKRGA